MLSKCKPKLLPSPHSPVQRNRDSGDSKDRIHPPLQDGVEAVTLQGLKLSSQGPHVVPSFFSASLECLECSVQVDGTQRSICYPWCLRGAKPHLCRGVVHSSCSSPGNLAPNIETKQAIRTIRTRAKSKEPSFLFMLTTQQPLCSNAKRHFDPFRVNVISGGLLWTSQKVKLLLLYTKLCTCLRAPLMQHATGCESRSAGLAVPSPNQHCCGKLSDNLNHSEFIWLFTSWCQLRPASFQVLPSSSASFQCLWCRFMFWSTYLHNLNPTACIGYGLWWAGLCQVEPRAEGPEWTREVLEGSGLEKTNRKVPARCRILSHLHPGRRP